LQRTKYRKEKRVERCIEKKVPSIEVRAIQRNLVYVIGIPIHLADEVKLKSDAYFGQYGKIISLIINRKHLFHTKTSQNPTVSCYVTYELEKDAEKTIRAMNRIYLDSCLLTASYGTNKYCPSYLNHVPCTRKQCPYLHQPVQEDSTPSRQHILM
jgi:CCR4-NOT transcription complex subunit 4